MKLCWDTDGNVNYDEITGRTTVQELLDAIDLFLNDNPLPCSTCGESCCKKAWAVEVDNVCVNRMANHDEKAAGEFVRDKLILKRNYAKEFNQYVLNKKTDCNFIKQDDNRCSIYPIRPIICRLYICSAKSYRYNVLRESIGAAYLEALVMEEKMRKDSLSPKTVNRYRHNPAVFARDYSALLCDIFGYARSRGWLDEEDEEKLYRTIV